MSCTLAACTTGGTTSSSSEGSTSTTSSIDSNNSSSEVSSDTSSVDSSETTPTNIRATWTSEEIAMLDTYLFEGASDYVPCYVPEGGELTDVYLSGGYFTIDIYYI